MPPSEPQIDRMINAAIQCLQEVRAHRLTVEELAERTGVEVSALRTLFADDRALTEAVGNYVAVQLTDAMSRAVATARPGDNRAALIALATAYVTWAQENRGLYGIVSERLLTTDGGAFAFHRYDASFVPLVRRLLGETEGRASHRAAIGRSFMFGITTLALDNRLEVWMRPGTSAGDEMAATITDFIDMLMAWQPPAA
ncbi:TetR/AcrR family transcriptional regulator [Paracoccus luteus]|uniref:TetR/AcrR family transcriptional regulator n=1 Tax=Paracoccus luteus TaxID=2508543 RepID=UPI00106FF73C|nr:TetR/AcrR family transcriptional regulator [Paracoccus luteus]